MTVQKYLQILLIGPKLINAVQIVIATNHLVGNTEAAQKFGSRFMTQRRTRIQFRGDGGIVLAILGLAQIAQGD